MPATLVAVAVVASVGLAWWEAAPAAPAPRPETVFLEAELADQGQSVFRWEDVRPTLQNPSADGREFFFTRAVYSGGRGWRGGSWATDYPTADRQFLTIIDRLVDLDAYRGHLHRGWNLDHRRPGAAASRAEGDTAFLRKIDLLDQCPISSIRCRVRNIGDGTPLLRLSRGGAGRITPHLRMVHGDRGSLVFGVAECLPAFLSDHIRLHRKVSRREDHAHRRFLGRGVWACADLRGGLRRLNGREWFVTTRRSPV